jgi:hypothetical protein
MSHYEEVEENPLTDSVETYLTRREQEKTAIF